VQHDIGRRAAAARRLRPTMPGARSSKVGYSATGGCRNGLSISPKQPSARVRPQRGQPGSWADCARRAKSLRWRAPFRDPAIVPRAARASSDAARRSAHRGPSS
jgi:hypothetical protein